MAYDEELADRVREHLVDAGVRRLTEQEMFGGISFLIAGNLCCGVMGQDLLVRIDPTLHHDALTRPGAREFEMGGRSSRGMIRVAPVGIEEDLDLALWLRLGIAQASSLPPKKKGAAKRKAAPAKKKAAPAKKKLAPAKKAAKKKAAPVKKQRKAPAKKKAAKARK